MSKSFAMLIGVDWYPPDCQVLSACVRDIEGMATHLKERSGLADIHIESFKATSDESIKPSRPREEPTELPTYYNIKSSLERLASMATSGDYIYVHFSGHGTSIPSSNKSTGKADEDLALVLLEPEGEFGIRYLHGVELAELLQVMVSKGILVTLVLDCCSSGAVARHDSHIRSLPYNPDVDAAYPMEIKQRKCLEDFVTPANTKWYRGASMRSNWLLDPDGYTILTACGPTEKSKDIIDGKGQRHGILSYFLMLALNQLGPVRRRHRYLYSHICSLFVSTREARKNDQHPMLYGNKDLSFFGVSDDEMTHTPIPLVKMPGGALLLEAGSAQGIVSGDQFLACPLNFARSALKSKNMSPSVETTQVKGLTSELRVLGPTDTNIQTGWMAIPLTRLALRKFAIRFEFDSALQNRLHAAMKVRPSLRLSDNNTEPASFHVTSTTDHRCEIRNEANEVILDPGMALSDLKSSEDDLLSVLEHLCTFRLVKELVNDSPSNEEVSFRDTFSVHIRNPAQNIFSHGCLRLGPFHPSCDHDECSIEVLSGDKIELVVDNYSKIHNQSLYVYVYNLGEGWEIENILRSSHDVVRQGQSARRWKKKMEMSVPLKKRAEGQTECFDIVKVFLSRQLTSFLSLEIPELGKPWNYGKKSNSVSRGDSLVCEQWEALSFRIHTKLA